MVCGRKYENETIRKFERIYARGWSSAGNGSLPKVGEPAKCEQIVNTHIDNIKTAKELPFAVYSAVSRTFLHNLEYARTSLRLCNCRL